MFRQTLAKKPRCYFPVCSLLISTLLISGCGNSGGPPYPTRQLAISKPEIINVENGRIKVTPPSGFCKDTKGSRSTNASAFLIFANCGYLNTNGRRSSDDAGFSGLVTTSVAKTAAFQDGNDVDALSEFLSTPQGLETLSTTGQSKSVSIVDKRQSNDGVYVQLRDTEATLSQNVWKSFLNRSDHLVTVTLLQNKDALMTSEQSMQFLQSYSETITLNPEQAPVETTTQPVEQVQASNVPGDSNQKAPLKKVGLLRRLLL